MRDIEYRYELKYEISAATAEMLKHQLRCLMSPDSHSVCDEYSYDIRSLYFDNPDSSAYFEKLNGEEFRKKYRMRFYNGDDSYIAMECKYKHENMTYKRSAAISRP
ncbi:MAG: VTC domain-containing protein, partial [Erysipelotrichaceae bacterium]|nr:VTC domain-containing protein [Erysipelotrichaceae bacterium]